MLEKNDKGGRRLRSNSIAVVAVLGEEVQVKKVRSLKHICSRLVNAHAAWLINERTPIEQI